ncbi:MAG: CRISPR-associated helicase Cas3', partial [Gammaproteobacteria bacterium]
PQYNRDESTASGHCNAWFADNAKKALLAHAGVGTVDQLMLAVLQSKHQCLRLLGLRGKVIVLDEVHAADRYMQGILETLLRFHAAAGGSVILLSATLPLSMRRAYVRAFCQGLGRETPELHCQAYPLLTHVSRSQQQEHPLESRASVSRTLKLNLIDNEQAAINALLTAAQAGQCACWVRNTVDAACAAYDSLKALLPEDQLTLFHARFTQHDRKRIEDQVLDRFGRESTAEQRAGRIVIGTQVLQESLDVDFDHMVSDLAPIDLLLQRAGRLRRHTRDSQGNTINGKDQRGKATLLVLSPNPAEVTDKHWLSQTLPRAELIYPDHGLLWKTAELIRRKGQIKIPSDLRDWIEAVYDEEHESKAPDYRLDTPETLMEWSDEAYADSLKQQDLASANRIDFDTGYTRQGQWWDEARTPTRLGEESITLRLARLDNGVIQPWSDDPKHPWHLSEVRVLAKRVSKQADYEAQGLGQGVEAVMQSWKGAAKFAVLVVMEASENDTWMGEARSASDKPIRLRYSPVSGLAFSD